MLERRGMRWFKHHFQQYGYIQCHAESVGCFIHMTLHHTVLKYYWHSLHHFISWSTKESLEYQQTLFRQI